MPVSITKIEDIGRQKIVRGTFEGHPLAVVVPEAKEIPAEPKVNFDTKALGLFVDSWRVEAGA